MAQAGKGNNEALKNQLQLQAQQQGSFQSMVQQEFKKIFPALQSMVPKHMTPERLMRLALAAISRTPKLSSCTIESLVGAVTACAVMGLEPNLIGHAYLVPFWNGKIKRYECQFQIGYKGFIDLVRRTGDVDKIDAIPVYENDLIVYIQGTESFILHVPYNMVKFLKAEMFEESKYDDASTRLMKAIVKGALTEWLKKNPQDQGKVTGYYSYYKLKNGSSGFKVMSKEEIEKHRDQYSKSKDKNNGEFTGPWKDNFDAMALKTCIKQMVKFMPISIEIQEHIAKDEGIVKFNTNPTGTIDIFNVDYSVLSQEPEPEPGPESLPEQKEEKGRKDATDPKDIFKGTPFET